LNQGDTTKILKAVIIELLYLDLSLKKRLKRPEIKRK